MKRIAPEKVGARAFYKYMVAAVAPRPIALVSTVSAAGAVNLSPFSFFNYVGIDPPIVVFAPNRRSRDRSEKDTSRNVREVPEAVVNLVDSGMVRQISLASAEFAPGINEFEKAGFTPVASELIAPPRVGEARVQLECKVLEIKDIGSMGLVIAEVVLAHVSEKILDVRGQIDVLKTDWIGRGGGDWYSRFGEDNLFEIPRPQPGIGIDSLPESVRNSAILTGNELGILGSVSALPPADEIRQYAYNELIADFRRQTSGVCENFRELLHIRAKELLAQGNTTEALLVILQDV